MMMTLRVLLAFWVALVVAPVLAEAIDLKKGLATEIWDTWPDEKALKEQAKLTDVFPEWRQSIGATQIANVRKAGFDFMRLTIDPFAYLSNASSERSAKLNAGVLEAIKMIRAEGLNVIVDLHAIPTGEYRKFGTETYVDNDNNFAAYVAFAGSLAKLVADQDPAHVAFEPMNEPLLDCDYLPGGNTRRWRAMSLKLHHAVRAAAPKLAIVMSGACWGGVEGLADLDPAAFKDDNIIWSFHSYDPFMFTHQGAEWTEGPEQFYPPLHFPPKASERAAAVKVAINRILKSDKPPARRKTLVEEARSNLSEYYKPGHALALHEEAFQKAEAWANKHGIPPARVMLGEFGANRTDENAVGLTKDRLAFVELSRKAAEKRGFVWSLWCWSGSMSPTNNDSERVVLPSYINALGLIPRS